MGKKKKKGSAETPDGANARISTLATPPSRAKSLPSEESPRKAAANLLILRLSKAPSKAPGGGARVILNFKDASRLDVLPNELAILLNIDESNTPPTLLGAAIAEVCLSATETGTPRASSGKQLSLSQGSVQVTPVSVDSLLRGSGEEVADIHQPLTTPVAIPVTPSTPGSTSSSFSFNVGGGGDRLYTSPSTLKVTPVRTPRRSSSSTYVKVIPLDSALGKFVSKSIYRNASKIVLSFPNNPTYGLQYPALLRQLIYAHWKNEYLQEGEVRDISFQGKRLSVKVVHCQADGDVGSELSSKLQELSMEDPPPDVNTTEETRPILGALHRSKIRLYSFGNNSHIEFEEPESVSSTQPKETREVETPQLVAGLTDILNQARSILQSALNPPTSFLRRSMKPPRGVLLHGPSGVGKSSLARQLAVELVSACDGAEYLYIHCASLQSQTTIVGAAERELARHFRVATNRRSKLLILDDIHLLCPKRAGYNAGADRLSATLLALLDGVEGSHGYSESSNDDAFPDSRGVATKRVAILAITSNPTLLDPALRRPGRLESEIEVPLPDEPATRAEIIKFHANHMGFTSLLCTNPSETNDSNDEAEQWLELAKQAKGFNGADCMLMVKEAVRHAYQRMKQDDTEDASKEDSVKLEVEDLRAAIRTIKPSAIKSITVEIPTVHWNDIGGMESVKGALKEAIELPLSHGSYFERLKIPQPRGILLYGPPGCSKTLMARALATESQMNFLAVKGPELLSKWLGESERALASLFRRARMASPAIIFFDEIDAIAGRRGHGDSVSSGRLLSQLLTEIDGINHTGSAAGRKQDRVIVVGATNRPDMLDPALTRPGRIEKNIYVGVPDAPSRARIFELSLRGRNVGDDIDIEQLSHEDISGRISGAEAVASVRDAALLALEEDDNPHALELPKIEMRHLILALKTLQRQITPEMLAFYASYQHKVSGI